jgi:hypothetical protein
MNAATVTLEGYFDPTPTLDGVRLFYVVRAVDNIGAVSPNSAEVSTVAKGNALPPVGLAAVSQ